MSGDEVRIAAVLAEHPFYRYAAKDDTDPTGSRHFIRCNGRDCNARLITGTYGEQGAVFQAHVAAALVAAGVGDVAAAKAEALREAALRLGSGPTYRVLVERESCDWWTDRPVADWLRDRANEIEGGES